ncbi:MAG: serine/threonine-protein kinase [Planctomycetaceae bacterium]
MAPTFAGSLPPESIPEFDRGCPGREQWQQFLQGLMSESERLAAETHHAQCPACQRLLDQLSQSSVPLPVTPSRNPQRAFADSGALLSFAIQYSPFEPSADSTEPAPPAPPPALPGFSDLHLIGRGGSGTVYRAFQTSLNRPVAVKILSAEAVSRGRERVRREADALARLKHPHIVRIYESGFVDQTAYLVMEWIEGGTLQDRIDQGPLAIPDAARLICQLAHAVEAVHALGIVHRDLKPANVLLEATMGSPEPQARLTDFGLAPDLSQGQRLTISGTILGTPAYMAPEQTGLVNSLQAVGNACDIYGLGAVAFAALTGQPPHRGRSTLDTLIQVAWNEPSWIPRLRPEVPVDLATIVAKCLRQRPGDRYRTAGELADDLESFLAGRPISARLYSWHERAWKWVVRRPAQATATGLLFLLFLAGIGGGLFHFWRQHQTLMALESQKQKTEVALLKMTAAMAAEKEAQRQTFQQLLSTTEASLNMIGTKPPEAAERLKLFTQVRTLYHQRRDNLDNLDQATAEGLARGLSAISNIGSSGYGLADESLADIDLAMAIVDRFPQSQKLRNLRAQLLIERWNLFTRLGRSAEAEQAMNAIVQLCDQQQTIPTRVIQGGPSMLVISTLYATGRLSTAKVLLQVAVPQQEDAVRAKPGDPEKWSTLLSLLAIQSQIEHELGEFAASDTTLDRWNAFSEESARQHPENSQRIRQVRISHAGLRLQNSLRSGSPGRVSDILQEVEKRLETLETEQAPNIEPYQDRLRLVQRIIPWATAADAPRPLAEFVAKSLRLAQAAVREQPQFTALKATMDSLQTQWDCEHPMDPPTPPPEDTPQNGTGSPPETTPPT